MPPPASAAAPTSAPTPPFADRLATAIDRIGSPVCVGLDPVADKLPAPLRLLPIPQAFLHFSRAVIDAAAPFVPAVKFQSACFEAHGPDALEALRLATQHAREMGLVVVLDFKRGDIGISNARYAQAAFHPPAPADAVTLNAYLGPDTIEDFLADPASASRGVFVLVRTSNPGSDAVQSLPLADGRTVAQMMADHVATLGHKRTSSLPHALSDVGAVVAATKPQDAAALRARMPNQCFLVPGFGAQGGRPDDLRAMLRPNRHASPADAGLLVTASRSVIFAFAPTDTDWTRPIAAAAKALADDVRAVLR
jgi:orotidine-5'-phosphate decarboxylase